MTPSKRTADEAPSSTPKPNKNRKRDTQPGQQPDTTTVKSFKMPFTAGRSVNSRFWGQPSIKVYTETGTHLATIPEHFLLDSKTSTWWYIVDVVERMTGATFTSVPTFTNRATKVFVAMDDSPTAGYFIIGDVQGAPPLSTQPPFGGKLSDTQSIVSSGSRSVSPDLVHDQSTLLFSKSVGTKCVLSGFDFAVEAAHLIPRCLGKAVFGLASNNEIEEVDDPRAGIPLSASLHAVYDTGALAFLPQRNSNIVSNSSVADQVPSPSAVDADPSLLEQWVAHVFHPPPTLVTTSIAGAFRDCHGTLISLAGVRETRPSWRLADWFYTQVVRVRFAADDVFD